MKSYVTRARKSPGMQMSRTKTVCTNLLMNYFSFGLVVELVDTGDLKSLGSNAVWVRVPPWPLNRSVAQSGQRA